MIEVVNLHETQQTPKLNINFPKINVNNIVLVYDEKVPRHFWRFVIVTGVLPSRDCEIRREIVRTVKTNTIRKRPVNELFPIVNTYQDTNQQIRHRNKS